MLLQWSRCAESTVARRFAPLGPAQERLVAQNSTNLLLLVTYVPSTELPELTYASSPAWHSHERQKRKRARSTVRLFKAGAEVAASRLTSNTQYGASNTQYGGVSAQSSVAYKLSSLEEVSSRHRTTFKPGLEVQPASFQTEV